MKRIPRNIQDALANNYTVGWQEFKETIMPNRILQRGKWELTDENMNIIEIPFTATLRFGKPKSRKIAD